MADSINKVFPDLGPKTINRLLQDRLSKMMIKNKEVPVEWTAQEASARKEIYPRIYIEFIDLEPAPDRQFSGILECEIDQLSDGTYADSVQIEYPGAYFAIYDIHLQAESVEDIVELVTEVSLRIPPKGHMFEVGEDKFRLSIQRPEAALNADITDDMFFHRIYTYKVESYLFDYDKLGSSPNAETIGLDLEVKKD